VDLGTGAIDDGAGVVVSMQAIHLLKELGIRPKRTVRFVAWMSEEEVSQERRRTMVDMARRRRTIFGAIECDLGADHPVGIYYAGKPALGEWLKRCPRCWEAIGAETLEAAPARARILRG